MARKNVANKTAVAKTSVKKARNKRKQIRVMKETGIAKTHELFAPMKTTETTIDQSIIDSVCEIMAFLIYGSNHPAFRARTAGDSLCTASLLLYFKVMTYNLLRQAGIVDNVGSNDVYGLPSMSDDSMVPSGFALWLLHFMPYYTKSGNKITPVVKYNVIPFESQCTIANPVVYVDGWADVLSNSNELEIGPDTTAFSLDDAQDAFGQISDIVSQSLYGQNCIPFGELVSLCHRKEKGYGGEMVRIWSGPSASFHARGNGQLSFATTYGCSDRNFYPPLSQLYTFGVNPTGRNYSYFKSMPAIGQDDGNEYMARSFLHIFSQCKLHRDPGIMLRTHPVSTKKCPLTSPYVVQRVIDFDNFASRIQAHMKYVLGSSALPVVYDSATADSQFVTLYTVFVIYCYTALLSRVSEVSGGMGNRSMEASELVGRSFFYPDFGAGTKLPFLLSSVISNLGMTNSGGVPFVPCWGRNTSGSGSRPVDYLEFSTSSGVNRYSLFSGGIQIPGSAAGVTGPVFGGESLVSLLAAVPNPPVVPVIMYANFVEFVLTNDTNFYKLASWVAPTPRGVFGGVTEICINTDQPNDAASIAYDTNVTVVTNELVLDRGRNYQVESQFRLTPAQFMVARIACVYGNNDNVYELQGNIAWTDTAPASTQAVVPVTFTANDTNMSNMVYGKNDGSEADFFQRIVAINDSGPGDGSQRFSEALYGILTDNYGSYAAQHIWQMMENRETLVHVRDMITSVNAKAFTVIIPHDDIHSHHSKSWWEKTLHGVIEVMDIASHVAAPIIQKLPNDQIKRLGKGIEAIDYDALLKKY